MACGAAQAGDPVVLAVRDVASRFVERVIVRMIPALQMLRRALPA